MIPNARGGLKFDFKPTPLLNAADWLISAEYAAALGGFQKVCQHGQQMLGTMGLAATFWAIGDLREAKKHAEVARKEILETSVGLGMKRPDSKAALRRAMEFFCHERDYLRKPEP